MHQLVAKVCIHGGCHHAIAVVAVEADGLAMEPLHEALEHIVGFQVLKVQLEQQLHAFLLVEGEVGARAHHGAKRGSAARTLLLKKIQERIVQVEENGLNRHECPRRGIGLNLVTATFKNYQNSDQGRMSDDSEPGVRLFQRKSRKDAMRGHEIEDVLDLESGLVEARRVSDSLHRLNLRSHELRAMRHDGLTSLGQLRRKIRILPHQVKTALRVLGEMQGRSILADEVGLGKTIEAGIILKELISRGKARSILIMTPAALATQWQQELWDKFGERFIKHDDPEFIDFSSHDHIVTSIDTAKSPAHQSHIIGREWDLVIIDEAHYLKNKRTQRYTLADEIHARYALMLTATPIQNNLVELYNLINLLNRGLLGTLDDFEMQYVGDSQGRVLLQAQRLQHLLRQVMIRNRRAETTGITFPERKVETRRVEATPAEYHLHKSVLRFIRNHKNAFDSHLGLLILEREVASSAPALIKTLDNMIVSQEDYEVREALRELRDEAYKVETNAKMDLVLEVAKGTDDRMIVFTQFRETQALMRQRFEENGITTAVYHGQLNSQQRKATIDKFRNGDAQVLIATDSGSEGLNLQFCHILVNYDLPWNPMRVEQRIGRVHRIGQERDHVFIINLAVANTIEDYVLEVLYEKIRLFEVAIGEMDLILNDVNDSGGLEKRILDVILSAKDDEEVKKNLGRVEAEVRRGRAKAQEIKDLDANVFQQFDLSTTKDEVDLESTLNMEDAVQKFVADLAKVLQCEAEQDGKVTHLTVPAPWNQDLGTHHEFTTDFEAFEESGGDIEFLSFGSSFIQDAMALLEKQAPLGIVASDEVSSPEVRLYYRYEVETLRSHDEGFITVEVTEDEEVIDVEQKLLLHDRNVDEVVDVKGLPKAKAEALLNHARQEVGKIVIPLHEKRKKETEVDRRDAEKRLEAYYEQQKEQVRRKEKDLQKKLRRIEGKRRATEDRSVELKLEKEHERLEKQYRDLRFRNNRKVEQLDTECAERKEREMEKYEPRLKVQLIGATRLLPR